jgi:hypothetical protein
MKFPKPSGHCAGFSAEFFLRIQAPMGTVVLPFAQVPRQTREKEAGAGGVTAQAGRMQQCTAQGSPGKAGGFHGRSDLRVSPIRSAKGYTVFIIRDSFSFSSWFLRLVTVGTLRAGLAVGYGVFTPYTG